MAATDPSREKYILSTGEQAAERLFLLNEIFGPGTRELLLVAGISPGMRVVEIGCGTGLVSLWMAQVVGTGGSVTAMDVSHDQLRVAERSAVAAGVTNVSFQAASAYDTSLPEQSFDLVYSRFLMCHLTQPLKALAEMRRLLKSGGVLVCEDHDDGGILTEPPTRAYKRLVEISQAVNRAHGLDSYIGLKLPRLMRDAGFSTPEVRTNQITLLRGTGKRFWEITLREAADDILAAGASTHDELESICAEMRTIAEDDSILLMLARVTQVWARVWTKAYARR
jgi:SAM-dependent methyltransferase